MRIFTFLRVSSRLIESPACTFLQLFYNGRFLFQIIKHILIFFRENLRNHLKHNMETVIRMKMPTSTIGTLQDQLAQKQGSLLKHTRIFFHTKNQRVHLNSNTETVIH
uniref:Uncharacterized protein n=1 Tax=Cacopsylla melanoneura TaxID=428564 RepID=A0A8D8VJQ8_9HEMI